MSKGGVSRAQTNPQKPFPATTACNTNTHKDRVLEMRLDSLRYTEASVYLGSSVSHTTFKEIVHPKKTQFCHLLKVMLYIYNSTLSGVIFFFFLRNINTP